MTNNYIRNKNNARMSSRARSGRSRGLLVATAAMCLTSIMQRQGVNAAFEYGDPITAVVTGGESLILEFTGTATDAIAFSFQQCGGARYMRMDINYNGTTIVSDTSISSNECNRILGSGANADDVAVDFDNLCAFRSSGTVGLGYDEDSVMLDSTRYQQVDPDYVTITLTNNGGVAASAELVMYSDIFPSPYADASIDRVHSVVDQDENTFTIDATFQASGTGEQTFCPGDEGCSVYAYYLEIVDDEPNTDDIFGTSCQARSGSLVYEGFAYGTEIDVGDLTTTTTDEEQTDEETTEVQVASVGQTAFETSLCVQFPKNTAAMYRVYVIVSPDTTTYARIGYGLQDQLIYASDDVIVVEDDMDIVCPENEPTEEEEEDSGAMRQRIVAMPIQASGVLAASLAAAAVRSGF